MKQVLSSSQKGSSLKGKRKVREQCILVKYIGKPHILALVLPNGYALLLQTVDPDLHCLPFTIWIFINNLDQVISLAEN